MTFSADVPLLYEFRIVGHLEPRWAAWFEGLTLTSERDGTTLLRGELADQAALHGILQRMRDAGLSILSVTRVHS